MEEIVKHINDTNASYRQLGAGDARNTDLFLDNEHYQLFESAGEHITVRYHKENLAKAILFIASILPRKFDQSSVHCVIPYSKDFVINQLALLDALFVKDGKSVETITQEWNARKDVPQKNGKIDTRFYFNGLLKDVVYTDSKGNECKGKFSIRNYFAGGYSELHIKKADDGIFDIEITNVNTPYNDGEENGLEENIVTNKTSTYRPYITAIKSKPFLLLAGISGTGKSRIVRELARACWEEGTDNYKAQKPKNFQMVQVKPNWHDSSDLIGYVSRVSGKAEFVAGEFLRFVAKAWEDTETPYFLCLDEMNLAPVEQYFAEYLSVIESRKSHEDGTVTTDPILEKADEEWFFNLTASLTSREDIRKQFNEEGICIPQNLIVVGTVNMDETTFSFSRKVLDRAMTIEMNEVDLHGGLTERNEQIGKLGRAELIGYAVEGVDVYAANKDVCDIALDYLQKVNAALEGKPFKVAYRTRNEFLLYVVNNLPYCKDENGNDLKQGYVVARALDEITSMKVLSRIEGDDTKVSGEFLDNLSKVIENGLRAVSGDEDTIESISLAKLKEMKDKRGSGYTSFWS